MRSVPEWIADHDDQAVPPRVKARIFEREGGRCHRTGRKIRAGEPWQLDHIIALCNGGEHRESNLAPILEEPHREKTAEDMATKEKITRIRQKHLGIFPKSRATIRSRGFQKTRPEA